ncbi:MAG: diguanylate cyclase [Spirochaetota bacterium]
MSDTHLRSILADESLLDPIRKAGFFFGDLEHSVGTTSEPLKALGFADAELRDGSYQNRIHPEDRPTYLALWNRVNEGWEDRLYCEYRLCDLEGEWHWIETFAVVVDRRADGSIGRVVGTDRDISSRKTAEQFLEQRFHDAERRYEVAEQLRETSTLVSSSPRLTENLRLGVERLAAIVEFDRCEIYSIEDEKPTFRLAVPEGPVRGSRPGDLLELLRDSSYPVIRDDLDGNGALHSWLGIPLRARDLLVGVAYLWHASPGHFRGTDLYPVRALGEILAGAIVSNLNLARAVADHARDELTGFLTRRSFDREIGERWARLCSLHAANSVAMVDVDLFKAVNDRYGHPVGDRVIRAIASVFNKRLRGEDLLARYGGEEFLIVLPHTSTDEAYRTMDRIREECAALEHTGVESAVTISVGVASHVGAGDVSELIARADAALYRAKHRGRNRVER